MLTLGRIVAALISGALLAQAFSLNPFWPLAWVAPIPLLIAAMDASRLNAFLYGALAGALSMALTFSYFLELSGLAPTLIITLIKALIWGGAALAARGAARHLPTWAAVFVFPALIAGVETLIATVSPHGSAGSLAYSQMDFIPVIQLAALGGAPAITFAATLLASAAALLVAKRAIGAALAPALIVVAAIAWGAARAPLTPAPHDEQPVLRVAALAGDDFDHTAADWRPTWESYAAETERLAREGARVIVLPEKIVTLGEAEAVDAAEQLAVIARQHGAVIVVGAVAEEGERAFNRAYFISPEGARVYDKHHMIPGFEARFTPGTSILFTDVDGVRTGVAICKDMDFPALARRYGRAGAALMLVPAWDFERDAWLHSRMAVLRGVESGFTIVRSAREGVMSVSDPFGYVLAEAPSSASIAALPAFIHRPAHVATVYARIGDAFGWLCAVLALALIGWTALARRRAGQGG